MLRGAGRLKAWKKRSAARARTRPTTADASRAGKSGHDGSGAGKGDSSSGTSTAEAAEAATGSSSWRPEFIRRWGAKLTDGPPSVHATLKDSAFVRLLTGLAGVVLASQAYTASNVSSELQVLARERPAIAERSRKTMDEFQQVLDACAPGCWSGLNTLKPFVDADRKPSSSVVLDTRRYGDKAAAAVTLFFEQEKIQRERSRLPRSIKARGYSSAQLYEEVELLRSFNRRSTLAICASLGWGRAVWQRINVRDDPLFETLTALFDGFFQAVVCFCVVPRTSVLAALAHQEVTTASFVHVELLEAAFRVVQAGGSANLSPKSLKRVAPWLKDPETVRHVVQLIEDVINDENPEASPLVAKRNKPVKGGDEVRALLQTVLTTTHKNMKTPASIELQTQRRENELTWWAVTQLGVGRSHGWLDQAEDWWKGKRPKLRVDPYLSLRFEGHLRLFYGLLVYSLRALEFAEEKKKKEKEKEKKEKKEKEKKRQA